jgi:hypothetical protein
MVNRLFIRRRETGAASCSGISDIVVRLVCFLFVCNYSTLLHV